MKECGNVLDILKEYEEALGQKMNRCKTSLFFSKSVPVEVKHGIKMAIGVPKILHYEKRYGGSFKGGKLNCLRKLEGKCS